MRESQRGQTTVTTVLGEIPAHEMGVTLTHEHLFNDMLAAHSQPAYAFSGFLTNEKVAAENLWALRHDPYCCRDNLAPRTFIDASVEVGKFLSVGGKTIVDATGSRSIGRAPELLRELSISTGCHIIMSTGTYLERLEGPWLAEASTDQIAQSLVDDLSIGVGEHSVRAGVIGEIGVSPDFTPNEKKALRAACLAQLENGSASMNIHMPGWQRRADEILDLVIDEMGVSPRRVSLAHSDPSGSDIAYQRRALDRGAWLVFDMIGLEISFPREGSSPAPRETAEAVANLIDEGYQDQILLSHDLFLKQMLSNYGGNGLRFIPTVFVEMLKEYGVPEESCKRLLIDNPREYLSSWQTDL